MGEGLDLAGVGVQRGAHQVLAVARRAAAGYGDAIGEQGVELPELRNYGAERRAPVALVVCIEELASRAHRSELRGRRARVYADVKPAFVPLEASAPYLVEIMAGPELKVLLIGSEEREIGRARAVPAERGGLPQEPFELRDRREPCALRVCRACRHKIVGILYLYHLVLAQLQRLDEALPELREEMQGPAEERDVAFDRAALGEVADGLVHDGLEDGERDVLAAHAGVHQGLHVGLREHAAARGDGMDLLSLRGKVIEPLRVGREQDGHLVDERAGAAGAGAVHALLHGAPEVGDLGVLAAELHGGVGLRDKLPYGGRAGDYLLLEGKPGLLGKAHGRGACKGKIELSVSGMLPDISEVALEGLDGF